MARAKSVRGKDLMLFVGGKAIALSTSHKLDIKADVEESSTKDDGIYGFKTVKKITWNVSSDSLVSYDATANSYDDLLTLMKSMEPIDVVFGIPENIAEVMPVGGWTTTNTAKHHVKGKGIITSLSIDAPNGGDAKMSISIDGAGALEVVGTGV